MSKRELAYNMIDQLTNDVDELDKSMGMFHDAADVSKIPLEKEAWATQQQKNISKVWKI